MTMSPAAASEPFLRNLWYVAALGRSLKPGALRRQMLLGEPVMLGRSKNGKVFALRDICPHRAMPLSVGRLTPDGTVECSYHGWRFRTDGICTLIPSLVEGQDVDPGRIRVRSYPVREQDGLIWLYMAAPEQDAAGPAEEPPKVPITNAKPRWTESQIFACGVDQAVIGLMDPAHAPYVHGHWWWRSQPRPKTKKYRPSPKGFVMMRHRPSKTAYRLLGASVSTEVAFELPGTRFENIVGSIAGSPFVVVGLTACTPLDAHTTQVTQVFYWPPWLGFIKPFFTAFGPAFLSDDRRAVENQKEGLKFDPPLMLIQDSDVPAMWYHRLKKAWAESVATGIPFTNPVQAKTLRWRS